jgi:hypothetical protein
MKQYIRDKVKAIKLSLYHHHTVAITHPFIISVHTELCHYHMLQRLQVGVRYVFSV